MIPFPSTGAPVLLIHPCSGGVPKCWPIDSFVRVADLLVEHGWRVAFVIGPAEQERMSPAARSMLADRFTVLAGLSLPELLAAMSAADVFLGNDSGPSHLAAALGRPTVALFGPTDPAVWAPRGRRVHILRGQPNQSDWSISPESVAQAITASLV